MKSVTQITACLNLQFLDLSENQITASREIVKLFRLQKLQEFYYAKNQCKFEVETRGIAWPILEVADLTGNLISSMSEVKTILSFMRPEVVRVLAVKDNPILNF